MEIIKINKVKSRKMFHMFWAFRLKRGLRLVRSDRLFEKYRVTFFRASMLADNLSANYRDWVAAQMGWLSSNATTIRPSLLCSEESNIRYLSYMKSRPQVSTKYDHEKYLLVYVRLVASTRKIAFEEALNVCLKMHFISGKLYTKFYKKYVPPKKRPHLSLEKQKEM